MSVSLGLGFPFRIRGGSVRTARGVERIEAGVRHVLSVRLGERVMLRDYGGGVHRRLQDPNDATLRALVKHEVTEALRRYMPEVRTVGPIRVDSSGSELRVVVEYVLRSAEGARRLELRIP